MDVATAIATILLSQMMLFLSSSEADCKNDITSFSDNLFVLSDEQSDADSARSICTASGGKLAEVGDGEVKGQLIKYMEKKYIPDLETITVHENLNTRIHVRFRYSGGPYDNRSFSAWETPFVGRVRRFKVHNESVGSFTNKISFCYRIDRSSDFFRTNDGCPDNWTETFEAFVSTNKVKGAFELIRQVFIRNGRFARAMLPVESIPESFRNYTKGVPTSFYIPGASVYIGARSDMNESKYYWSNETEIRNASSSNRSVCQQMTWPLTYDDGIKLSPKECSEQAHYVCQYNVSFTVAPLECNGSSLLISWNNFSLAALNSSMDDLTLQINSTGDHVFNITRPFQGSQLALSGLRSKTNYSFLVSLKDRNCTTSIYRTSLFATTCDGFPDEVKRAYVENSTLSNDGCYLAWEYDPFDKNITKFKITGNDDVVWEFLRNDLNASSNLTTHFIDLSMFESQRIFQFKIQAVFCDCESEAIPVEGSCQAPLKPPDDVTKLPTELNGDALGSNGASIGISLGIICTIMLLVAGFAFWRRRKTRKEVRSPAWTEQTQPSLKKSVPDESPPSSVTAEPFIQRENSIHNVQIVQASEVPPQVLQEDPQTTEEKIYENAPSKLLQANDLEAFFVSECQNQFKSLKSEFEAIVDYSNYSEKPHEEAKKSENKKLNRYRNIYPYDHSRVILGSGVYINASVLQKHATGKTFIATQGPKPSTLKDFWEMVWEQDSSIVVMLCNCMEMAKESYKLCYMLTKDYEAIIKDADANQPCDVCL